MIPSLAAMFMLGGAANAAPVTATDKPVQVFIMMGQSNMLGEGRKEGPKGSLSSLVENDGKYQYLWDKEKGNWSVSPNVRR